jgi:hypothetical protein
LGSDFSLCLVLYLLCTIKKNYGNQYLRDRF